MRSLALISLVKWSTLGIGLFCLSFKYFFTQFFRKRTGIMMRVKLLTFYKTEHIYSTTSIRKRDFMTEANWLTIFTYVCLLPSILLLFSDLLSHFMVLLNAVL